MSVTKMLIYEVTAEVDRELAIAFEKYMADIHIPDLLATGHFEGAFFAKNGSQYKMGYRADSQEALDAYLANDAERMRAEIKDNFPTGIEYSRQVLEIVKLFPCP